MPKVPAITKEALDCAWSIGFMFSKCSIHHTDRRFVLPADGGHGVQEGMKHWEQSGAFTNEWCRLSMARMGGSMLRQRNSTQMIVVCNDASRKNIFMCFFLDFFYLFYPCLLSFPPSLLPLLEVQQIFIYHYLLKIYNVIHVPANVYF